MIRRPLSFSLFPYTPLFRSRHLAGVRDPVELHPADGLVRGVVHVGRLRIELPGGLLRRIGEVLALGARRDVHLAARSEVRSEEHTSELQSLTNLVCRLLLET